MPERLLTTREAADYLRLTPGAIYTQRVRGELPGALGLKVGKKLVFRPSDLERFLDEQAASVLAQTRGPCGVTPPNAVEAPATEGLDVNPFGGDLNGAGCDAV